MTYTIKTTRTKVNPIDFINDIIDDEQKQKDSLQILEIMEKITGEKPHMWGKNIIGFVPFLYESKSGCKGEWFKIGFSPRKTALTCYLGYDCIADTELLEKLGKHKTGKACLYIKKLSDIDIDVLTQIFQKSLDSGGTC